MNFRELEAFDAVLKTGSITEAARYIHRTQPQTTRLIAALENRIGFKLFDRSKKRFALTANGREFHDRVQHVLESVAELDSFSRRVRSLQHSHIRVLCSPHLAYGLLPQSIEHFQRSNPDCTISVDVRSRAELNDSVSQQQYDLAIAVLPIDDTHVNVTVFNRSDVVAAVPFDHALAKKKQINIRELAEYPIITSKPRTIIRMFIENEFQKAGLTPNVIIEHPHSAMSGLLVERGLGVALLEHHVAVQASTRRVKIVKIRPTLRLDYAFITPRLQEETSLVASFRDSVIASSGSAAL